MRSMANTMVCHAIQTKYLQARIDAICIGKPQEYIGISAADQAGGDLAPYPRRYGGNAFNNEKVKLSLYRGEISAHHIRLCRQVDCFGLLMHETKNLPMGVCSGYRDRKTLSTLPLASKCS